MTPEETGHLLARAALYDNRKVDAAAVIAWHGILGDLPYPDCEAALGAHYAESTDWLMPAHIRRRVMEVRNARLNATEIPEPPREIANNPPAYRAAVRAAAIAIADGRDPEPAMQAVAAAVRRELEA